VLKSDLQTTTIVKLRKGRAN